MTSHRLSRFTPAEVWKWTFTVIGCTFLILFSVAVGGSIFQWTYHQLQHQPVMVVTPVETPTAEASK